MSAKSLPFWAAAGAGGREITGSAGSQLCPTVVAAFRSLFENDRFTLAASEGVLRSVYEPLGRA